MKRGKPCTGDAWQLLLDFFFSQRANLPPLAAELELSPAQCHVLHLIEPGRPIPMGELAETLSCDASNVTGLVDRLESRGLVRRRPSPERPPREGVGFDADRFQATRPAARSHDTAARHTPTPLRAGAAGVGAHSQAPARMSWSHSSHQSMRTGAAFGAQLSAFGKSTKAES